MSLKPMPFLSGRVPSSSELHGRHDSPSDIVSVISLPKVQQALWLDYLVRPYACHYYLRLEVDLTSLSPTLERLLEVVQTMGKTHPMLRTTFHLDGNDLANRPFMAVHSQDKLSSSLRRSFDLSSEFPVR
ncbi:hypothetical protein A1F94_000313 [Pyrenophora tritici-repentis]|uniref:Condensation domain containing protein n=1 Tax=Pyrenophora tritici-repentis TaxID=45151 RepID=A0A2W1EIR4_9PLEO|nr:hypothetical protein PtrV1_00938 [Pyrenophora tritici-repentis]KAF7453658.1 hypothetical protein A1F99_009160 [Pyrenophora tritici-repentis]KAF7576746.1 Condensation domain containing protein [Pyrenophora tritici-repentis]KAG9387421.1 hypothetical protein A1F94_000313 [Pyrenophora tritici-repentis]KAI0570021.1 hypothetical protein Alg215_11312 [Pyrenophora tritici-repentis]